MNNVIDITNRFDDWVLLDEWHSDVNDVFVRVLGNYRKNSHEIRIEIPNVHSFTLGIVDIARLQHAIKKYEER